MATSNKASKVVLDFSNVKEFSGVNPKHKEPGDYSAKIVGLDASPAKDGEPMWRFDLQLEDDHSATYPYYCKLVESQLWKVRNLLMAAGFKTPKSKQAVDPNRLIGKTVGITLSDDEYEGKLKSVIDAIFPASELAESAAPAEDEDDEGLDEDEAPEDDEETEVPEDDDEDEDEEEEPIGDEFDEMDRVELRKALKAAGLPAAKKSESDDDLRARLRDTDEDEDEDEMDVDL